MATKYYFNFVAKYLIKFFTRKTRNSWISSKRSPKNSVCYRHRKRTIDKLFNLRNIHTKCGNYYIKTIGN